MDATLPPLNPAETVVVPVIMAGGSGTRLWPLSRESYPKQFLPLVSQRSLLQETALRAARIRNAAPPLVIGSEAHRFLISDQLQAAGIAEATVMLEPEGRNTAAVAAVAAHFVAQRHGPTALALLLASDHTFGDDAAFAAAVDAAVPVAAAGRIVTFGIRPTRPETGYGYIRQGEPIEGTGASAVAAFVEKPSLERARAFLEEGGYSWNGGMFLFRADRFLRELRRLEPELAGHAHASLLEAAKQDGFVRLAAEPFGRCRKDSVDYAVMEKTGDLAVVPLDAGWDDVGCWTFMGARPASDGDGNCTRGDVVTEASSGNLVYAGERLVALVGVTGHVVVETADAVLVASRERAQDVKQLVQKLKGRKRPEAETHPRVHRPWGFYETIAMGERFQVKRISVKPGHKLSLQMHHHRAEHWTIVQGTARVTVGEREFLLSEDESTYIPIGEKHRLENPGKLPLELIEVQSGAYLGEDDIVRFEDVYGRAPAVPSAAAPATLQAPPAQPAAVPVPVVAGAEHPPVKNGGARAH